MKLFTIVLLMIDNTCIKYVRAFSRYVTLLQSDSYAMWLEIEFALHAG